MADDDKKKRDIEELQKEAIARFKNLDDVELMEVIAFLAKRDLIRVIGELRSNDVSIVVDLPFDWNDDPNMRRVAERFIRSINTDVTTRICCNDDCDGYVIKVKYSNSTATLCSSNSQEELFSEVLKRQDQVNK